MRLGSAFQEKIYKDYSAGEKYTETKLYRYSIQYNPISAIHTWIVRQKKSKGPRRRYRTVSHGNGYSRWIIRQYSEWLIALKAGYSALNTTKTNNCTAVEMYLDGVAGVKENVNYKKGTEMKYRDGYSVIIYTRTHVQEHCEFNEERYEFFDYTEAENFFLKQRDRFGGWGADCPNIRMCACCFKMNRGVIIKSSDQYYMMEYITRNGETEIYRYPEKREPFPVFEAGKEYVSSDGKRTVEILSRTKCYITVRINRTETKKCRVENLCAIGKRPVEACFDKDIGWVEARNKKL